MTDEPIKDEILSDPDQTRFHTSAGDATGVSTDEDETSVGAPVVTDEQASPKLPVLGDYVLLGKIGAGGMGKVFKARHRRMDRIVALKVLPPNMMKHPEAIQRLRQHDQRWWRRQPRPASPSLPTCRKMLSKAHFFA